jgi:dienelactone hydrolase
MSATQTSPRSAVAQPSAPRLPRTLLALAFLPLLLLMLAPPLYNELRAASILMQVADAPPSVLTRFCTNPVSQEVITYRDLSTGNATAGNLPTELARIYHPIGIAHPSAIVVVHGAHHLGMNEPRLVRLSQALASHGYLVLTPQVNELADYSITKKSATVIGAAVHELVRRSGAPKVGLLGLSFAGGMALIAATDPAVARELSVVIAIGAHDDLRRVLDYYETNGQLITVYSHPAFFFSSDDVPHARAAIRALLWENLPLAHAEASKLSPQGLALMTKLFAHDTKSLAPDMQRGLAAAKAESDAASPHFYLSHLHVPVMLLHGATDNVVPPTETLWLAHDMPPGVLKDVLITSSIGHVEIDRSSVRARLRLLQWMKQMLGLLDTSTAERG